MWMARLRDGRLVFGGYGSGSNVQFSSLRGVTSVSIRSGEGWLYLPPLPSDNHAYRYIVRYSAVPGAGPDMPKSERIVMVDKQSGKEIHGIEVGIQDGRSRVW